MKLYVMRHGEAAFNAPSDAQRPLTLQGEAEARCMGQWLAGADTRPQHVWVSPYLRARQTLNQVAGVLGLTREPRVHEDLVPMGHPGRLVDDLAETAIQHQPEAILLVSHMPLVSDLVALLSPASEPPLFATGAIAVIDWSVEDYRGQLEILHTPWQAGLKSLV